jgi:hypothetical protein
MIDPHLLVSPRNFNLHHVDPANGAYPSAAGEVSGRGCPPEESGSDKTKVTGGEKAVRCLMQAGRRAMEASRGQKSMKKEGADTTASVVS